MGIDKFVNNEAGGAPYYTPGSPEALAQNECNEEIRRRNDKWGVKGLGNAPRKYWD